MRKRWTRWSVLGHEVIDGSGVSVGKIVDTWPFGGGEVELVVVRLSGTFGSKRMLAVEDLWSDGFFDDLARLDSRWFSESWFARFAIEAARGSWRGVEAAELMPAGATTPG